MQDPFRDRSDEDLVRLAQSQPEADRGREAAACVLQRHAKKIYVWCSRYAGNDEEACDLAQEVLLEAYRRLHTFEHRSRFTSWLFSLARYHCLNHVRKFRPLLTADLDPDTLPSKGKDPERLYLDERGETELRRLIIEALSPEEQHAIWLRGVERMSIDSITEVLGLRNSSGARALLQRARRKLRAALDAGETEETEHG